MRVVAVVDVRVLHRTWHPTSCQLSSQCHQSSPVPVQSWPSRLPLVDLPFVEIYLEAPSSSCSPSQSRRLVVLPWLAAIETHKIWPYRLLQSVGSGVSQIHQANLKFLPVLTQQQVVIGNHCSQNSQILDRAIARWCQTHDVDVCGAGNAYHMVAKSQQ